MIKITFMILAFLAPLTAPLASLANGGDQRVVENKYLINLSRAPFTPRVGTQTSFLASFVDISKDKLINEDMIVKIRISKLGGGRTKREFVFEQDNVRARGGVLDFKHTFLDSGLHEVFFDFAFASKPEKVYEAPDFLIDVQKPETEEKSERTFWPATLSGLIGLIAGLAVGRFIKKA